MTLKQLYKDRESFIAIAEKAKAKADYYNTVVTEAMQAIVTIDKEISDKEHSQ